MKKGFTLIELLVSLIIISLTTVFMSVFILNLKDQKNTAVINVPILVDQAAISKRLNEDAINYGISGINTNNKTIRFKNGFIRKIQIVNSNTIKYLDVNNDNKVLFARTLSGNATFTSNNLDFNNYSNGKKYYKYVIGISTGNNIELYYYGE